LGKTAYDTKSGTTEMARKFERVTFACVRRVATADDGKRWQVQYFRIAVDVKKCWRIGNLRQQLGIGVVVPAKPMMIRALQPITLEFVHCSFRVRRSPQSYSVRIPASVLKHVAMLNFTDVFARATTYKKRRPRAPFVTSRNSGIRSDCALRRECESPGLPP